MKVLHYTLAVLFLAFTIVQFNDPDPLLWIIIYGAMVAVCVLAAQNRFYPKVLMVQGGLYLIYCGLLWSGVSQWFASDEKAMLFDDLAKMQYPYIEESREFLGLAICVIVQAFYLWLALRGKNSVA
jgi:energy-coupling factor transporter transmembrane protein EcfT